MARPNKRNRKKTATAKATAKAQGTKTPTLKELKEQARKADLAEKDRNRRVTLFAKGVQRLQKKYNCSIIQGIDAVEIKPGIFANKPIMAFRAD